MTEELKALAEALKYGGGLTIVLIQIYLNYKRDVARDARQDERAIRYIVLLEKAMDVMQNSMALADKNSARAENTYRESLESMGIHHGKGRAIGD